MGLKTNGWEIEVLSWQNSCHPVLKEWAKANGTFIALDDYYNWITFIEGLRDAKKFTRRLNHHSQAHTPSATHSAALNR